MQRSRLRVSTVQAKEKEGEGMSPDERTARRDELKIEIHRKLREINEESERLVTLDPLWAFNDIHKLQSLIGQVNSLLFQYRRHA